MCGRVSSTIRITDRSGVFPPSHATPVTSAQLTTTHNLPGFAERKKRSSLLAISIVLYPGVGLYWEWRWGSAAESDPASSVSTELSGAPDDGYSGQYTGPPGSSGQSGGMNGSGPGLMLPISVLLSLSLVGHF